MSTFTTSFDQHGRDHQLRHSHRSTLVVGCKRCPETAVNDVVNSRTASPASNSPKRPGCPYRASTRSATGGGKRPTRCPVRGLTTPVITMLPLVAAITNSLPLAKQHLHDAVAALADPQAVSINGAYLWAPPVYTALRGMLRGAVEHRIGGWRATAPCRTDILAWLVEVDRVVGSWEPDAKGTILRLQQLAGRGWRPQDCDLIERYTDQLLRWNILGAELLAATPRVFLEVPCPRCSARHAYHRDSAGEKVRTRALRVAEDGARCGACGAQWEPSQFRWLAKLLVCPSLP